MSCEVCFGSCLVKLNSRTSCWADFVLEKEKKGMKPNKH